MRAVLLLAYSQVAVLPFPGHVQAQRQADIEVVRTMVAAQATASLAGLSIPAEVPAKTIVVWSDTTLAAMGVDVWRARMRAASQTKDFLVAKSNQRLIRLGGFPAPDLYSYQATIRPAAVGDAKELMRQAIILGLLADSTAPEEWIQPYSQSGGGSQQTARWRAAKLEVGADTIITLASGHRLVRVTILGRATRESPAPWLASTYCFVFDAKGSLDAWVVLRRGSFYGD